MSKKIIFSQEQKEYIKQALLKKRSLTELSKEFKVDFSVIQREAHLIMGDNFDFKRKSYINLRYFQNIDSEEKAYWLGFIAADGYLYNDSLSIQLSKEDKGHLQKFSNAINGNFNINTVKGVNNFGKNYEHSKISVRSKEIINDLNNHGVYENKSLILNKPLNIEEKYYPYWILGYLDGDGGIYKNKTKIRICFTGTYEVISFIKNFLESNNKITLEHRCTSTYKIQIENNNSLNFLLKYDYLNLSYALDRKKDKLKNLLNSSLIQ